jgi:hypothetical protein
MNRSVPLAVLLGCVVGLQVGSSAHDSGTAPRPAPVLYAQAANAGAGATESPAGRPLDAAPELPRAHVDVRLPSAPGRTVRVGAQGNLQAAIEAARPGDELVLDAGATYTGPFTLRKKDGSGWIIIRSSGTLPEPGTRVTPAQAAQMAKLVSRHPSDPVIRTQAGAHHYRLIGLEVTAAPDATRAGALVTLGNGGGGQNTLDSQPHDLVLDRMYIHGTPTLEFARCVALNSAATAIVDSWISECHGKGRDSQAIAGWNGTGPYAIVNNHLEGAGENVMFGGADPKIPDALPRDIEFRRNHVVKPPEWKGVWTVKNLFELKIGQRVLVEGNVFENNWKDAQVGFGIVLKSANQENTAPWSQTSDVTFRYNIVRNSAHGLSVDAHPAKNEVVPAARFQFSQNAWERIGKFGDYAGGRLWQISGIQGLTFDHNTGFGNAFNPIIFYGQPVQGLVMVDNILGVGKNLVASGNGKGIGTEAFSSHATPGWIFRDNIVVGARAQLFPPDNRYVNTIRDVGFADPEGQNWRLGDKARLRGQPGVDVDALAEKTRGVVIEAPGTPPGRATALAP